MIQLYRVYKSYGDDLPALADLTLDIAKGEFVFVTGPSGAGKSTLLRLIFSAEVPNKGYLLVNGRNTSRLTQGAVPYLRRNIGVVFQDFKLLSRRTVEENVAISLEVLGLAHREVRRRTLHMLKQVGLAHKMHQLPPRLSGGEQQRVAIARALVHEPQILLADEPTGNLDKERSQEIMSMLAQANARGTTVVVATHDKGWLAQTDKRVVALDRGQLTC